jgi:hypothetical protein
LPAALRSRWFIRFDADERGQALFLTDSGLGGAWLCSVR